MYLLLTIFLHESVRARVYYILLVRDNQSQPERSKRLMQIAGYICYVYICLPSILGGYTIPFTRLITILITPAGGIIQHHCSGDFYDHAIQIIGYDLTGMIKGSAYHVCRC